MSVHEIKVRKIDGTETTLGEFAGKALLVVNVASKCGLTPQYAGLQKLHEAYADKGFTVLGFPCNQFAGQEPGTNDEIVEFCTTKFSVDFPLFDKIDVNGDGRHALYASLAETPDPDGKAGDVVWNFEKFVVGPDGTVVARFRPMTQPDDETLVSTIESVLP